MMTSVDPKSTIYAKDRSIWRSWLEKHQESKPFIWLIYFKKGSGKESVSYNDAVEEAICFGWIDGQVKSIDEDRYMQRYSPRKEKSNWSVVNIERANRMMLEGFMTDRGLRVFKEGMKKGDIIPSSKAFDIPEDLMKAIEGDKTAHENFQNFPPSTRLAFVYRVNNAKTEATRKKRIDESIELLKQNKRVGEI